MPVESTPLVAELRRANEQLEYQRFTNDWQREVLDHIDARVAPSRVRSQASDELSSQFGVTVGMLDALEDGGIDYCGLHECSDAILRHDPSHTPPSQSPHSSDQPRPAALCDGQETKTGDTMPPVGESD